MSLIVWFARNPVAANLLMVLIIAGGITGLFDAKRYVYPPEPQHQFMINTVYDGAGPGEVEQAVCIPTEEALHDLAGVRHIYTIVQQAFCHVTVDFDPAVGATRFRAELQARMDAITTFPQGVENSRLWNLKRAYRQLSSWCAVPADTRTLQHYRDRLQTRLSTHPMVGQMLPFRKYLTKCQLKFPNRIYGAMRSVSMKSPRQSARRPGTCRRGN